MKRNPSVQGDKPGSAARRRYAWLTFAAALFGIFVSHGAASAQTPAHVGFKPARAAGVAFSSLDLQYAVKDGLAVASVTCVARAENGRAKRISVDYFPAEDQKGPAIVAAQSQRGLPVSDSSDSYCWATSAPIADPKKTPAAMRMKVTNFETGEFTEVDLEPVDATDGRRGRRHRNRR